MALTAPTGEWTDEQKALRKSLNEYFDALNEGHLEDDAANRFNRDKWDLIRKSGVLRIPFDTQWGGLGLDVLTLCTCSRTSGTAAATPDCCSAPRRRS